MQTIALNAATRKPSVYVRLFRAGEGDSYEGHFAAYIDEATEAQPAGRFLVLNTDLLSQRQAEIVAVHYALAHGLPLYLPADPDGSLAATLMAQVAEREERQLQLEVAL